jgi:hypothetical protein
VLQATGQGSKLAAVAALRAAYNASLVFSGYGAPQVSEWV